MSSISCTQLKIDGAKYVAADLLVIGVTIENDHEHPHADLRDISGTMNASILPGNHLYSTVDIVARNLMPCDPTFYTYYGSLTTPP